jgi:death-on-curing protein
VEPSLFFLNRAQVDRIHSGQLENWGGRSGLRNENGLESAIAQAQNVYAYESSDLYELAATYAYHLAESQAYFDGNKRVGIQAALDFLEIHGIDTAPLPEQETYQAMIKMSAHQMKRSDLAAYLRSVLAR